MGTRKGLLFALEDDQVGEVAPEADMAEVTQVASDVVEQAGEVDSNAATLNDSVDDIGELTQVQDVLQKGVDSGEGVSEETAEIAEIAVEAICARLGVKKQRTIPSLESFGSKHTRLSATKIAVESVGETIDKAWQAVKAFFIRMWGHVREFFKKVWAGLIAFKNNAKSLVTRVFNATFKAGDYVLPGGMTVQEYTASVQGSSAGTKDAAEALKAVDTDIAKVEAAAKSGNAAEVDKITSGGGAATESMALENFLENYYEKKQRLEKEAAAEKSKMAIADAEAKALTEQQAKEQAQTVVKAVETAAVASDQSKPIEQGLANTEKAVNGLAATATTEVKAAQAVVDKNASPEEVAKAKEKISMWTKIKGWVSKAFSAVSSFVTGVFKRVMALIKYGFHWVKALFSAAGSAVKGAATGTYNAVVKGKGPNDA